MSAKSLFGPALLVLFAHSLFAQAVPAENTSPQLTIYSRTVVEDVVVLDKAGKAVPGLRKEDFRVSENGKAQAITFFEPNFGPAEAAPQDFIPAPDTFTNIRLADPGGVTNVLLLDAVNTWPEDEMYAHVQMVKFLASLPPHLRIGIFTLTPEKLNLIWPLNQDSSVLRDAVVRFSSSHSASATTSAQQQALLSVLTETHKTAQQAQDSQLAESAVALQKFLKHGVGVIQQHNHGADGALEALAHYLAGIPGRKNLFWIVGNFPHCEPENACSETIDALGDAGVSLYPIDAWGVDVNMGLGPFDWMHQAAGRLIDNEYWAEATGGKAYHVNDISREIADGVDHGSRYYTLAYVPTDRKEEGRERTVDIKVAGDYTLSYRRHYLERTQKDLKIAGSGPASNPLLPLMGHGLPNSSGIPYRLKVVPVPRQPGTSLAGQNTQLTGKLTRYGAEFQLQGEALSLIADADGTRHKSLQVALMVYGQDFKPLNWEIREIHLSVKTGQSPAQQRDGIVFHLQIDAPKGDVYLRTGVYDPASGKVGTLEIPLAALAAARR
jgi:VWFA-related protein